MTYKRTGLFTGYKEVFDKAEFDKAAAEFDKAARDTSSPWLPPAPVADTEASETRGANAPPNPMWEYCSTREACAVCQEHDRSIEVVSDVGSTLTERGKSYGDFSDNAQIAQDIKFVIRNYVRTHPVAIEAYMEEALDLIATKIGRLLSGNTYHLDGWHDIAGYATLVEQRLNKRSK